MKFHPKYILPTLLITLCSCITSPLKPQAPTEPEPSTLRTSPEAETTISTSIKDAVAAKKLLDAQLALQEAKRAQQIAENKLHLGREAAKAHLITAATWSGYITGTIALLALLALIASTFIGGIGRNAALIGIATGVGGIFFKYILIAYGVAISEIVAWATLITLSSGSVVALLFLAVQARRYILAFNLSKKRAIEGRDAADAIMALPVNKPTKKTLHDAWSYLADPTEGDELSVAQAKELLAKYRLASPEAYTSKPK